MFCGRDAAGARPGKHIECGWRGACCASYGMRAVWHGCCASYGMGAVLAMAD